MIHKMIPNKKKSSDLSLMTDYIEMIMIFSDKCAYHKTKSIYDWQIKIKANWKSVGLDHRYTLNILNQYISKSKKKL